MRMNTYVKVATNRRRSAETTRQTGNKAKKQTMKETKGHRNEEPHKQRSMYEPMRRRTEEQRTGPSVPYAGT